LHFSVRYNFPQASDYDFGNAITTDAVSNILVTGYSRNSSGNYDMVIWRYR